MRVKLSQLTPQLTDFTTAKKKTRIILNWWSLMENDFRTIIAHLQATHESIQSAIANWLANIILCGSM